MEELLPSEVARLILGFLKENKCEKSWKIFLEECSDLYEYSLLYKRGKLYTTNVNGKSLLDILKEYYILKNEPEKNSIDKLSESVSEEKKVTLEESVRNAVEQVIQKYLPCFCKKSHHRCDLLTDESQIDYNLDRSDSDDNRSVEKETKERDQSNNTVILQKNISKRKPDSYKCSVQLESIDCDTNSSTEELISKNMSKSDGLDHNLQLIKHSLSDRIYMQDIIKVEKDGENCTFLEHQSVEDHSTYKEINSHTPSVDECMMMLHSTQNNSVSVKSFDAVMSTTNNETLNTVQSCKPMQTSDCSLGKLELSVKVEPGSPVKSINKSEVSNCSQNYNTVTHVAGNHNSLAETNETAFCSIQSTRGSVNNIANPINSTSSHPGYTVHPFASQSLPVSNMSYASLPTYFVQNYPSNSSLSHSNSQYSFIINTPATGTATTFPLAIPGILPNNNGPTLTSVTSLSSGNPPSVLSVSNNSSSNSNAAVDFTNTCGKSQTDSSVVSLSRHNPSSVLSISNNTSSNRNVAAADFTNICGESETDSTLVLNSVCKAAEALSVAPTETRKNAALVPTLIQHKSSQKTKRFPRKRMKKSCDKMKDQKSKKVRKESSKKGNLNNHGQQLCSKKKNKYENLAELHNKRKAQKEEIFVRMLKF